MRIRVTVDVGSIFLGVVVGLAIAPFFYDKNKLKSTMRKGAVKEVVKETKKGLFGRKKEEK